jgi:hypothetical protein
MGMTMVSWNWHSRDPPGRGTESEGPHSNEVSPNCLDMIGGETEGPDPDKHYDFF